MKFKTVIFLAIAIISLTTLNSYAEPPKKLSITCSLFPVYEFAREVAGEFADVDLLLRPGVEPHEFEPSPMDVKALNDSQVFIFTGDLMEPWAKQLSLTLTHTQIINASRNIELVNNDPHVWLDMSLAQRMIANILEALCEADPGHAEIFAHNAETFCRKLADLDEKFMALRHDKTLVFAGEFAAGYFVRRYGFEFVSAFNGENEPSIKRLAEVLSFINENKVRYILSGPVVSAVTSSISEQTGAKILTFDTAETNMNKTFIEVMQGNFEALEAALNND